MQQIYLMRKFFQEQCFYIFSAFCVASKQTRVVQPFYATQKGGQNMGKHFRTIDKAASEILAADPNTAITKWMLRSLIRTGEIPSVKRGNRYLVALEDIEAYLANVAAQSRKYKGVRI